MISLRTVGSVPRRVVATGLAVAAITLTSAVQPPPGEGPDLDALAARIDALVRPASGAKDYVDDATFARRAYLTIVGRIPTAAEIEAFEKKSGRRRHDALVDQLLASPGYVSASFHWWADLLRVKTRLARQTSGEPFTHWLKESIAADLPYDEMVRQMLTAEGPAHAPGNGDTGFLLRDRGMPESSLSNTLRVFLGSRLECAQCHDHPYDKWTQRQYYEMLAFTGGVRYQLQPQESAMGPRFQAVQKSLRADGDRQGLRAFRRLANAASVGIAGSGTGAVRLPEEYLGEDAEPGEFLAAHTIFGVDPGLEPKISKPRGRRRGRQARNRRAMAAPIDSRAAFADWMLSDPEGRFATVIANRLWKRVVGRGVIEPIDDIKDSTRPSNPELMALLADTVRELNYDLRRFLSVVLRTDMFRRKAILWEEGGQDAFSHGAPMLRRLSAEQLWDSMLTLVIPDVDSTLEGGRKRELDVVHTRYRQLADMDEAGLRERVEVEKLRQTDPQRYRAMMREERQAGLPDPKVVRPLQRRLAVARRRGNEKLEQELLDELAELGVADPLQRARKGRGMVRASELPSPAPAGHFLRTFGQSERDEVDASHRDANVPQVLTLLNGFTEEKVLGDRESVLRQGLEGAGTRAQAIRFAFLSILGRDPSRRELALWQPDLAKDEKRALRDLVWTLINTHEFRFLR